ncbi:MAG TPA: ABC transporter ATP-binding protein/permease [Xanthobacteraceae bacterium]|jgi:putative ATP-binding cassette transporter|nr:ABC transporter ATP-binding protein/permease [Xanthobacteraceae bacterium]
MSKIIVALRTFFWVALPYFNSEERWRARGLLAGVVGAELSVVYLAVAVSYWQADFFNALEARDWNAMRSQLVVFVLLAIGAVVTGMLQFFFGQMLLIRWREWLTRRYVGIWMADARHYRIRSIDPSIDNIHLRIASDVMLFIQRTLEIGVGLLSSFVSLASFSYILWGFSAAAPLPLFGYDLSFPGYLIFGALAYASLGMVAAHFIGRRLIPLNFKQQRREADFRFAIARVTDQADPVALMRGEPVERGELNRRFDALVLNWLALVYRQTKLNGFVFGYFHVSTVLPLLILTPAFLVGAIPLGVLIQGSEAFRKVESAFAFCTSYAKIAEWKALLDRVSQFEAAMLHMDEHAQGGPKFSTAAGDAFSVSGLALHLATGEAIARVPDFSLVPGERLLVDGPSGAGKSSMFRALAGVWPLGEGDIRIPPGARVLALPQRPYFPLGSLKQALCYPMTAQEVDDGAVRDAMAAAGLIHLADHLSEEGDWSTVLSGGEQQRGGFARALINRPTILLLDEAVSTLEEAEARDLYCMLKDKLPGTIVISIGAAAALGAEAHRTIAMTGNSLADRARRAAVLAPV